MSNKINESFSKISILPQDEVIKANLAFLSDTDNRKVNLAVGLYKDDHNKSCVFNVVRKVEKEIANDHLLNKDYLPIEGSSSFNLCSQRLVFGENCDAIKSGRIVTVQTISGTGSLRVGFEFIKQEASSLVWVSNPPWANHHNIIKRAGLSFKEYPYYDPVTKGIQFENYLKCLNEETEPGNIILMHASAHNPTGVDPTEEQWKMIAEVMKKRDLVPYFDSAYQGFASGDIIKDGWPIRYFAEEGFTMFVSQSYSKNMGLYGERVGALHILTQNKETAEKVLGQIRVIIRANYFTPPLFGSRVVERILSDHENMEQWKEELKEITCRIIEIRSALRKKLEELETPGKWNHITEQIGMFSYTGLNEAQVKILVEKYHIHMIPNGRMSMVGINSSNVEYIAEAIKDAVVNAK